MDWSPLFSASMPGVVTVTPPVGPDVLVHWYQGESPAGDWSDVGLAVRLSQEANPYFVALAADVASLAEMDALLIDERRYLVTRQDALEDGLVRVELMPDREA